MATPGGILRFPDELIRAILDQIEQDPDKLVSLDRRSYLSQESFRPPPPRSADMHEAQDVGNFRLTCQRFSTLGAIHQFAKVTTRFSRKGLHRLENIASQPQVAKHVKKFTYMVPYFYVEGRERVREILPNFAQSLGSLDVRIYDRKVREQRDIVRSEEDSRILHKAILAFTALQHVQILRVQDREDEILLTHLRQDIELARHVELKWAPACSHSAKTLGAALLAAHSPCSRFSSPMFSPQSAHNAGLALAQSPNDFSSLAQRLTSLELHFDDGTDLDNRMMQLSVLFKAVFTAATNMQAIHIGFPSHRPLSLRLDDLFHEVKWERLSAFGIQAWKLDADEIIALVLRHRDRLRGLRLRDVLLKDNSMWKNVLGVLRDDMPHLDWVSLRRIGYAKHFDEQWGAEGVEVPDDLPGGASDSDSDEDESEEEDSNDDEDLANGLAEHYHATDDAEADAEFSDDDDASSATSDSSNGHGPHAHEMNFPQLSPGTPSSAPWCTCGNREHHYENTDNLGDNGIIVSNAQRKMWEKWVVRRCVEHMPAR